MYGYVTNGWGIDIMSKDKRTGWLLDLKIGDKVIVSRRGSYQSKKVSEVLKITPTGRIKTPAYEFNHKGEAIGDWGWSSPYLGEWSQSLEDEIKNAEKKKGLVKYFQSRNFDFYDFETLENAKKIFDSYKK